MILSINSQDLLEGLNIVTRALSSRPAKQILEGVLMHTMFDAPSKTAVRKVVIKADNVENGTAPTLLDENGTPVDAIAFFFFFFSKEYCPALDLLYRPILNDFRGRKTVEAQVFCINT